MSSRPGDETSHCDTRHAVHRGYRTVAVVVAVVLVVQAVYAGLFIYRSSFVVEGQRYFCLFDDAMISMRYASNWAAGHGLVWNSGERVEGYTNFLWTAVLALIHKLPSSPATTCLVVQVLGIPLLWGCVIFTVLLARACRLPPGPAIVAGLLTAWHYNLIFFSLMGMETPLLTLLLTWGVYETVCAARRGAGSLRPAFPFALAVLVRLDAAPQIALAMFWLCCVAPRRRGRTAVGWLAVGGVTAAHFLFRHMYYGQWLPNTYYLKMTGWPLSERLVTGLEQAGWAVFALAIPAMFALFSLLHPRPWKYLLGAGFLAAMAYHVYVGGDAWPLNRFVLPATPALFVLAAEGVHSAARRLLEIKSRFRLAVAYTACAVASLIGLNIVHWDHFLLVDRPQTVLENRMNVRLLHACAKVASPQATAAVAWAGAFPYFSGWKCFDLLGKCDPHIARLPAHPGVRRAGHNKYDINYTLRQHRPDVVLHAFAMQEPAMRSYYYPVAVDVDGRPVMFFVRRGSTSVRGGRRISIEEAHDILLVERGERRPSANIRRAGDRPLP